MRTNRKGIELIKKFEGFSAKPYICPGNKRTIGFGHVIKPTENFVILSEKQAEALLIQDLRIAEEAITRLVTTRLNENQFSALASFVFNLGQGNFSRSTLLRRLNENQMLDVPQELMRWTFASGKRLIGLMRRRVAEAQLFLE
jgi:lysozyme